MQTCVRIFPLFLAKNALVFRAYLLRVQINIAENAHTDTHRYMYSACSFSVLVSSRCRSYARIEHSKSFVFWCIFNLYFCTNFTQFLANFGLNFPTKLSLKSAFLSLFSHSPCALVALKKLKKTRRCLNPAAGARDRRITALKKSSLQQQKSTKRRMEFPSETAGNAGWISKSDGIITPKEGRPRGKHRVKKI